MAENNTTPKIGDTRGPLVYTEDGWKINADRVEAQAAQSENERRLQQLEASEHARDTRSKFADWAILAGLAVVVVLVGSWLFSACGSALDESRQDREDRRELAEFWASMTGAQQDATCRVFYLEGRERGAQMLADEVGGQPSMWEYISLTLCD